MTKLPSINLKSIESESPSKDTNIGYVSELSKCVCVCVFSLCYSCFFLCPSKLNENVNKSLRACLQALRKLN